MYRALGLTRDPFAPVCDGDLYWEDGERAGIRRSAAARLREGVGLWLSGPPGSGRGSLLTRVAEELASEGRPVLCPDGPVAASAEDLLAGQLAAACGGDVRGQLISLAEALYGRLLEAFGAAGPVACFPGALSASPAVVAEVEILSGLRVLGRPLAAIALAGAGDSPLRALQTMRLPSLSPEGLRSLLSHRLAACGGAGLLPAESLDRIACHACGIGEALALGRRELSALAFRRALEAPRELPRPAPEPEPPALFDASQVDEISELLDSLGPAVPAR